MRLAPKEEILVELFRSLDPEQRKELMTRTRALVDANRVSQDKMRRPLKIVADARIEAKFGLPKKAPHKLRSKRKSDKPQPSRPDRNQDDSTPET